jgi:hypothetical protein
MIIASMLRLLYCLFRAGPALVIEPTLKRRRMSRKLYCVRWIDGVLVLLPKHISDRHILHLERQQPIPDVL